jgi:hypothetical protein
MNKDFLEKDGSSMNNEKIKNAQKKKKKKNYN